MTLMVLFAFTAGATTPVAALGQSSAKADWQVQWERTVEGGKREGKVSVIGPVGPDRRDILVQPFQQKYGITVEYLADRGSGIAPRVTSERGAGQYLWDVVVHGTPIGLVSLIPGAMIDPMEPALLLPEVKEPRYWRGGALEFVDPGRHFLVMTPSQRGTLFVNPTAVQPDEIKSYKDLLNPKWKSKIVMDDPRNVGPGQATFTFFYLHPNLGPDFIRALAKQEPTVLKDFGQELDSVIKGKHLVLIGVSDIIAEERMKKGLPVAIIDPRRLKEGSDINPGAGGLALFNRAPHPNAAKVYINWLLSKDGQTGFARVNGYISSRLDVPTDHSPWRVPIPGSIKTYTREAIDLQEKVVALVKEAFGQ